MRWVQFRNGLLPLTPDTPWFQFRCCMAMEEAFWGTWEDLHPRRPEEEY